jgi:guanylate kinase
VATPETIDQLTQAGEVLYRNARYGAEYAIDRPAVAALVGANRIPVLHMGQVAGVSAVTAYPIRWTTVLLWCPREVTEVRCMSRGDRDVDARLKAWEETRADLLESPAERWSLVVSTDQRSPTEVAQLVIGAVSSGAAAEVRDIPRLVGP